MEKEKTIPMPVANAHAAGIDVGSRLHYVAVGQGAEDVSTFKVYTKDHVLLVKHLSRTNRNQTGNYVIFQ